MLHNANLFLEQSCTSCPTLRVTWDVYLCHCFALRSVCSLAFLQFLHECSQLMIKLLCHSSMWRPNRQPCILQPQVCGAVDTTRVMSSWIQWVLLIFWRFHALPLTFFSASAVRPLFFLSLFFHAKLPRHTSCAAFFFFWSCVYICSYVYTRSFADMACVCIIWILCPPLCILCISALGLLWNTELHYIHSFYH